VAHVDPLILFLFLWPHFRFRPLAIEYIYRQKGLHGFLKWIGALPVPNLDTGVNQIKIKKAEQAIVRVADALRHKDNVLLYPSGHLKSSSREILGGASGVQSILQSCPEANIVLIRTIGLWGSSFSRALVGYTPNLSHQLVQGLKVLLKNFLFFAPRRDVLIEFSVEPQDLPREGSRLDVNRYLEQWYNRYPGPEEPLALVSSSAWRKELPQPFQPKKKQGPEYDTQISSGTRAKIYEEIRRIIDRPEEEVRPEMHLAIDLGLDSLNIAELIAFLSANYDVRDIHPEDLETVQDALGVAEGGHLIDQPPRQLIGHIRLPNETGRPSVELPLGRTLAEAFFRAAERMRGYTACADDVSGVMSYRKMKRMILVLAQAFRKLSGTHVAVMLPASVGAYVAILALLSARKVPVMLNWTLGPRYLDEMMKLTGAERVVSSWRFLERLSSVDFGSLVEPERICLLEDVREEVSLGMKLRGLFLSFLPTSRLLNALGLNQVKEEDTAVVLFTSGTETVPKGVPLSHRNILINQRSALQSIDLRTTDILYGVLPPFHSFGFSVTGMLPLFLGMRVAFYPDPTDSFALAEGIDRWKATIFCSAPSFLKGLLEAATPDQLASVRLFVSGAEQAPPQLFEKIRALKSEIIQGYGITECAPILSLNHPGRPLVGVGHPLADIELCTIHPETHELLPLGSEGELCVRGPNVFAGYLGKVTSPFIEIDGRFWYRTGDLGHLTPDGQLLLSGRLKRFVKVGGEMISLGAVESALNGEIRAQSDGPAFALCADERRTDRQPQLILFSTVALERDQANDVLRKAGFSRLVKISAVRQIPAIPLLGTGKTDYRRLQSYIT
jgi:long-chain-fatty-acid--[acyl-carrier-protein] ligase